MCMKAVGFSVCSIMFLSSTLTIIKVVSLRITRIMTYVSLSLLSLSISACDSSNEPRSIGDLTKAIEKAGYSCQEPQNDPNYPGETEVSCGESIGFIWYDTAAGEVDSYSNAESIYSDLGMPYRTIRGETWHVLGSESDLTKIAKSMGTEISVGGAK